MRSWIKLAALPVGLVAAAFLLAAARGVAATEVADITGDYGGKAPFKYQPLTPLDAAAHGSNVATMTVTQTGSSVTISLVLDTATGPKSYNLSGAFGQNMFYGVGNGSDGHMVLTGKVTGQSPNLTLKGDAKLVISSAITTMKFILHQTPPV